MNEPRKTAKEVMIERKKGRMVRLSASAWRETKNLYKMIETASFNA